MKIPCIRCGKEIESPNAGNAKYIINPSDTRTYGFNKIEKIINAPLTKTRIIEIMTYDLHGIETREQIKETNPAWTEEEVDNYINTQYEAKLAEFSNLTEVFPDSKGRREVVIEEEVEVPKTAIVCLDCVQVDDAIIW